ncbi:MAG: MBL fold metallo-hydrolase [Candidatus Hydrogenedentes bacterium]|nr:MBL fold metallo-hydrolase [Candidatus Hydrogenedentota bacterium]
MSTVTFTPIGGGAEIGANCYQFNLDGCRLLLDCGIHPKKEGREGLPEFSLLREAPDAVVVSHGHIDHCGAVPSLMKEFPSTVCYATKPTVQIMDRMLHNSVSVMGTLAVERGIRDYPLYTHGDVDFVIRRTYGVNFEHEFAPVWESPIRISFHHAGHVLGSASILLRNEQHTLFYTGDICATNQELMGGLTPLNHNASVDTLVIESTRAANDPAEVVGFEQETYRFADEVTAVLKRGGTVLVPCFALGRSQEMLNIIARLQSDGLIPDVPVYASGLGRAIYEIYGKFAQYLRPDATLSPLRQFQRIGDVWERSVTRDLLKRPGIIVATSGMMVESTPSAMIALEMVREKRHGIFFVGYLDPDSLGYKLLHAKTGDDVTFEWGSPPVKVRLENLRRFNFSAHAARNDLVGLIDHIKPKNVVFMHGDPEAIEWMHSNCHGAFRKFSPAIGETVVLET